MVRVKSLELLTGRWQGNEDEYVATTTCSQIIYPDQSQKQFQIQGDLTNKLTVTLTPLESARIIQMQGERQRDMDTHTHTHIYIYISHIYIYITYIYIYVRST